MVTVARNVHVSVARPNDSHSEVILAADPKNAGRLLAGVHIAYGDTIGTKSIAYASFDSGKTWSVKGPGPKDDGSATDDWFTTATCS